MKKVHANLYLLASVTSLVAGQGFAQTTPSAPADAAAAPVESAPAAGDIVVTALHRKSSVQNIPLSIAALSGDTLAKSGASQIADYFRQIPNLNLTQGPIGSTRISIRGVNAAGEATVGLYYDETPVTGPAGTTQDSGNNAADLNLFDVERVEVLRGPQGTLYGASSMAGTLRVIFNKPNFSKVEGSGEAEVSAVEGGAVGYFVKGMANLPVITDKLAVRVVGYYEDRPGYIDNVRYGTHNINGSDNWGVRGLVGFRPDALTDVTATVIYQKSTANDLQGWYPSVGKYETNSSVQLPFDSKLQLYNLKGDRHFGWATLTATGSYYKYDILRTLDFSPAVNALSYYPAACQGFYAQASACTTSQLAAYHAYGESRLPAIGYQPAWLESQNYEVRLASDNTRVIQWTVGAYYERRHDHIDSNTTSVSSVDGSIPNPLEDLSYRYVETHERQLAGFGEVSITPIDKLTITGGARYYDYSKTTSGEETLASVLTGSVLSPYSQETANAHGWLEKVNVSYRITPRAMVYAEASKGFRPGGANNIPTLPASLIAYAADSLWNYELGAKTSWLDNRLILNGAVFQIDWSDMQVSSATANGLYQFLTNAGKARIRGGEFDLTLHPIQGLTVNGAAGYTDARLTQNQSSSAVLVSTSTGLAGDRIPNTPDWTASAGVTYTHPLTARFDGMVRVDYAYTGKMSSQISPLNPYYTQYGDYSTVNVRAGIEKGSWGAYAFVRNLANVAGVTGNSTGLGFSNLTYSIPPRTFGLNVRSSF